MQPDGVVTPCFFIPIPCGNMLKESFQKIWNQSPVMVQLRDRNQYKENCGSCNYRKVCGGCRARAYAYFGDYLGPDPGCKFNQIAYQKLASA